MNNLDFTNLEVDFHDNEIRAQAFETFININKQILRKGCLIQNARYLK
jgi:hypothetical protein